MQGQTKSRFDEVSVVNLDLEGALEAVLEEATLTIDCDDEAMELVDRFLVWEEITGLIELEAIPILDPVELPPPLPPDA